MTRVAHVLIGDCGEYADHERYVLDVYLSDAEANARAKYLNDMIAGCRSIMPDRIVWQENGPQGYPAQVTNPAFGEWLQTAMALIKHNDPRAWDPHVKYSVVEAPLHP